LINFANINFILVQDISSPLVENWKKTWLSPFKRQKMITGSVIMLFVVLLLPFFFSYIEKRKGVLINDWLLAQIQPSNVSVIIFTIIWGLILLIVIRAISSPSIYITFCWTYVFVCTARVISISLVPLAPPVGFIPLTDPLTSVFYGHAVITKDLFFSGHVSTLTLIALCLKRKTDKVIAWVAVITVAFLLLVQHIHYTIDVLAAPVIVYALYRLTRNFLYKGAKQARTVENIYLMDK
jgi:hypothetical protein